MESSSRRGVDGFSDHRQELLSILRIGDAPFRQLLRGPQAQERGAQLGLLSDSFARRGLGIACEPRAPRPIGEELQLLNFPAEAMSVMLALRLDVALTVTLSVDQRDRLGLVAHDPVPDLGLDHHAVMFEHLEHQRLGDLPHRCGRLAEVDPHLAVQPVGRPQGEGHALH